MDMDIGEVPGLGLGLPVEGGMAATLVAAIALVAAGLLVLGLALRWLAARPSVPARARALAAVDLASLAGLALAVVLFVAAALTPSSPKTRAVQTSLADTFASVSVPTLIGRNCTRAPFRLKGALDGDGFAQWLQDGPCRFARTLSADLRRLQAAHEMQAQACTVRQRHWLASTASGLSACLRPEGEAPACLRAACERDALAQTVMLRLAAAPQDFKADEVLSAVQAQGFADAAAAGQPGKPGRPAREAALWMAGLLLAAAFGLRLAGAAHRLLASLHAASVEPPNPAHGPVPILERLARWGLWRAPRS